MIIFFARPAHLFLTFTKSQPGSWPNSEIGREGTVFGAEPDAVVSGALTACGASISEQA